MKNVILGISFFVAAAIQHVALAAPDADAKPLRTMTYNLRYASDTPPNSWGERLPVAVAMLNKVRPDVFGTQEGKYGQLKDLQARLPDYRWIGLGRNGGSRGEFMAVFYRTDRLEPLEFDHFWLSDTPEVMGSTTWGNSNRRMVTWVRFRDRITKREFYFWNTHFDHEVQVAREKSAKLVLARVQALKTGLPVLLVGDFNATAGENVAYDTLVNPSSFKDTWLTAEKHGPLMNTFHGYREPGRQGRRIDWILSRGNVECLHTEIVTFKQDNQYPSDHFPVLADVLISDPK